MSDSYFFRSSVNTIITDGTVQQGCTSCGKLASDRICEDQEVSQAVLSRSEAVLSTQSSVLSCAGVGRVADVDVPQYRRYSKGQGLLRKEGPRYFVAKLSIVAIYALYEWPP